MSVEQRPAGQVASRSDEAVAAALVSVRAEGLEPSPEDLAAFGSVAAGELSTDDLRARILARYEA